MGTHRAHRAVDDHSGRCAGPGARHGARMGIRASTRIARRLEPVQRRSATVANPTAKVKIKMKSIRAHTFFALVSLATVAGAHAVFAANEVREEFRQTYPLDKQGKVRLDNVNGNVRIVTWDREEIKVEAIKRAKKQEHLDDVKIEVEANANVSANTLTGGIISDFGLQTKKHFPIGQNLDGKLGAGGPAVNLSTVNGGIHLVRAKTVALDNR